MNRSDITGTSTYSFYYSTITSKLSVRQGYRNTKYIKENSIDILIYIQSDGAEKGKYI